ncbi:hypothetical protein I7I51_02615 [Histoplasma capsulatum]|uniref:Uncharacterized protein n=1 Tax=Ajellomyces capsulatus TaxID=5037 RepID=A0A8A1MED6_AJECA|nr:hypothetical protein I7I51_02615 [Histoplasma capsulatum]
MSEAAALSVILLARKRREREREKERSEERFLCWVLGWVQRQSAIDGGFGFGFSVRLVVDRAVAGDKEGSRESVTPDVRRTELWLRSTPYIVMPFVSIGFLCPT